MAFEFLNKKKTEKVQVWYVYAYSAGLFSLLSPRTHISDHGTRRQAKNEAARLNALVQDKALDLAYSFDSRWDDVEVKEK